MYNEIILLSPRLLIFAFVLNILLYIPISVHFGNNQTRKEKRILHKYFLHNTLSSCSCQNINKRLTYTLEFPSGFNYSSIFE